MLPHEELAWQLSVPSEHSSLSVQPVSPDPEYPEGQSPQMRPFGILVHVVSRSHSPLLARHSLTSVGGDEGMLEGFGVGEAEGRKDGL